MSIVSHVESHWLEDWLNKTKLIISPKLKHQNCIPWQVLWHSFTFHIDRKCRSVKLYDHHLGPFSIGAFRKGAIKNRSRINQPPNIQKALKIADLLLIKNYWEGPSFVCCERLGMVICGVLRQFPKTKQSWVSCIRLIGEVIVCSTDSQ